MMTTRIVAICGCALAAVSAEAAIEIEIHEVVGSALRLVRPKAPDCSELEGRRLREQTLADARRKEILLQKALVDQGNTDEARVVAERVRVFDSQIAANQAVIKFLGAPIIRYSRRLGMPDYASFLLGQSVFRSAERPDITLSEVEVVLLSPQVTRWVPLTTAPDSDDPIKLSPKPPLRAKVGNVTLTLGDGKPPDPFTPGGISFHHPQDGDCYDCNFSATVGVSFSLPMSEFCSGGANGTDALLIADTAFRIPEVDADKIKIRYLVSTGSRYQARRDESPIVAIALDRLLRSFVIDALGTSQTYSIDEGPLANVTLASADIPKLRAALDTVNGARSASGRVTIDQRLLVRFDESERYTFERGGLVSFSFDDEPSTWSIVFGRLGPKLIVARVELNGQTLFSPSG